MAYCPSCESEYRSGIQSCPECDVDLEMELSLERDLLLGERVDVYVCYHSLQLDRVTQVLADRGIETMVRNRVSSCFPTPAGSMSEMSVAVRHEELDVAQQALEAAMLDGALVADGAFTPS
jgi:hypothetical protein